MANVPAGKRWQAVPRAERIWKGSVCLLIFAGCSVLVVAGLVNPNPVEPGVWAFIGFPWLLSAFAAFYYFMTKRKLVPTPEVAAAVQAQQAEKTRKQQEMQKKWWFRYPIAALCIFIAWKMTADKPDTWPVGLILLLVGAYNAREGALAVLGVAVVVAAFIGIAALPVSVAVVLGAAMIAYGIYRAKDPSIDTKLPIVGKWIEKRRTLKAAAELYRTPFSQMFVQALKVHWDESEHAKKFSAEHREHVRQRLIKEMMAIGESANPLMENRKYLADAVLEQARMQVLVMPPPPEADPTTLRGRYGISGELKSHLVELTEKNKELREWFYKFGQPNTWVNVWDAAFLSYLVAYSRANIFSALRKPLDDCHPVNECDWFVPFLATQCAAYEDQYRRSIGMPSTLPEADRWRELAWTRYFLFAKLVLAGVKYPDLEWRDRLKQMDESKPGDGGLTFPRLDT